MTRGLVAVFLAAALPAQADYICGKTDIMRGFTLSCVEQVPAVPGPIGLPPPPPAPPTPPSPVATTPCPPNIDPFVCLWLQASPVSPSVPSAPSSGSTGYAGFDLTPGNPKINSLSANVAYAFNFTAGGASSDVGYGIVAGTDSGMHVTSWATDAAGTMIGAKDTRVVGNWQPFTIPTSPGGKYRFWVQPWGSGPLMTEQIN